MRTYGVTNFQQSPTAPQNPILGDTYFDTTSGIPYIWNGTIWLPFQAASSAPIPPGGNIYQRLGKKSDTDFDIEWQWQDAVLRRINQVAHGLSVGNLVRLDVNGAYVKSQADTEANAEVIGAIHTVLSADAFLLITHGRFTAGSNLTISSAYYLSPTTAGTAQLAEPTTPGQISKPVFIADSSTTGWLVNMRGNVIPISDTGVPTGTILPFSVPTAPSGYLICNGSAISRSTYAGLFAVLGTRYGVGDGSSTFNLPNLKQKFMIGMDAATPPYDGVGAAVGSLAHQHILDDNGAAQIVMNASSALHNFGIRRNVFPPAGGGNASWTPNIDNATSLAWGTPSGWAATTAGVGLLGRTGAVDGTIVPPSIVINFIIKT